MRWMNVRIFLCEVMGFEKLAYETLFTKSCNYEKLKKRNSFFEVLTIRNQRKRSPVRLPMLLPK